MFETGMFSRPRLGALGWLFAAVLVVVAVSACGGSSHRSNLDPAAVVPSDVPLYLSAEVPDSGQLSQFRTIVDDVAGPRAWTKLSRGFEHSLATKHSSWKRDVAPWIGSHVGLAILNVPQLATESQTAGSSFGGAVVIFPTNDMKAALAYIRRIGSAGVVAKPDGKYMLVSDASTLSQFTGATGAKLTANPGYQAVATRVAGDNATVYASLHTVAGQLLTKAGAGTASGVAAGIAKIKQYLAKIPANAALGAGFGVHPRALSFDIVPHDLGSATTGAGTGGVSVGGLPADSILAAALNLTPPAGFSSTFLQQFTQGFSQSLGSGLAGRVPRGARLEGALSTVTARIKSVLATVLPALGPLRLAAGGTSLRGIHAGVVLASSTRAAAAKLISTLYGLISARGSVPVSGNAKGFTVTTGSFKITVTDQAGKVVALLNEANAAALLTPASPLSSSAAYRTASGQLPSGATVPFYLSFSGLDTLLGALPADETRQARQVLGKLSYLILGTTASDIRLVLGLN